MNPERWQEVEAIYHAALERPEADRAAFVREACREDEELLHEVESLLGFDSRGAKLLEQPAAMSAGARPALSPGTRLGAYEVIGLLGAGGMGEVYRARDTRLGRTVALKVLPGDVMRSPERRERFEREARAVSRLSHPHICTLYDVGREGDTDFLVMEYLEGEPLAQRLQRGPLPLDEALGYAVQVAGALDVAHRQGVIHRDLKPANVVLTGSGAKLLEQYVPGGILGGLFADTAVANGVIYANAIEWNPFDPLSPMLGHLFALSADTLAEEWHFETPFSPNLSGVAVANGVVYFQSLFDGHLYALDATTGDQLLKLQVGASLSGPAVSNGRVYMGTGDAIFRPALGAPPALPGGIIAIGLR